MKNQGGGVDAGFQKASSAGSVEKFHFSTERFGRWTGTSQEMIAAAQLSPIVPKAVASTATADHVQGGLPIPKVSRVKIFSPDEFEAFVEEWASSLEPGSYVKVRRFAGSGDMGIDIAGFTTENGFGAPWDSYQCKRYDHPLRPSDVYKEIGKIIFYSWKGEFTPPRKHYFAASQDIGTGLEKLLAAPAKLKKAVREKWSDHCQKTTGITSTQEVPLEGALLAYFEGFDFTIFSSKSVLDLIEQHAKTKFHSVRFGGGLPPRPPVDSPPTEPDSHESRYVRQLLDAYADHAGSNIPDLAALAAHPKLSQDFLRQRERFYHAEALRNFSRDTVPDGTFDALQEEIYQGVVDVCESNHDDGFERMKATVTHASQVPSTSNPLAPATKVQDRQGICHQLANDDRLRWVPSDD